MLIHLTHHNFIDENGYQLSHLPPPLCLVSQTAWPQQIKPRSCYGSSCWGLNSWPNGCCSAVMLPITRHRRLNVIGSPISSNSSDISKATCLPQKEAAVLVIFNSRILEFLTSGRGYRGNLLFYRSSCRRASNPCVRKMTSGAYHLSHNNFEVTEKCIHTNEPSSWHDRSYLITERKLLEIFHMLLLCFNFSLPDRQRHKIQKILSFIEVLL